jgi:hypothetical protein
MAAAAASAAVVVVCMQRAQITSGRVNKSEKAEHTDTGIWRRRHMTTTGTQHGHKYLSFNVSSLVRRIISIKCRMMMMIFLISTMGIKKINFQWKRNIKVRK